MSEEAGDFIVAEISWGEVPEDELIDEGGRKGLPSASEYPRMHACGGYIQLKKKQPPRDGRKPNDAALSGQRIHAALAEPRAPHALTDEEHDMLDRCERQWQALMDRFFTQANFSASVRHEHRIFYQDEFSGQFDRIAIELHEEVGLMVDFKTGRVAVAQADTNLQMRAYAVLLATEHPKLKKLYVAIIQPWVSHEPIVAEYDAEALRKSRSELDAVLRISKDPTSRRIPGDHCKYCPCRKDCPEARAIPTGLVQTPEASLLTNEEAAAFLDQVMIAESVIEAVKTEAKRRLKEGQDIPGWELGQGRVLSTITRPEVVFGRVARLGVTDVNFMKAVKVQKTALKTVVKEVTNLKGKGLDEQIAELLDGCTEDKVSDQPLRKKITV